MELPSAKARQTGLYHKNQKNGMRGQGCLVLVLEAKRTTTRLSPRLLATGAELALGAPDNMLVRPNRLEVDAEAKLKR